MFNEVYKFFFYYVPYRSYQYYKMSPTPKFSTFILLVFILTSHIFSIFLLIKQYLGYDISVLSSNKAYNKFVLIPSLCVPFVLLMLIFYKLNSRKLISAFKEFDESAESKKKVRNMYYWIYISFSILFFFASITSPLWLVNDPGS